MEHIVEEYMVRIPCIRNTYLPTYYIKGKHLKINILGIRNASRNCPLKGKYKEITHIIPKEQYQGNIYKHCYPLLYLAESAFSKRENTRIFNFCKVVHRKVRRRFESKIPIIEIDTFLISDLSGLL